MTTRELQIIGIKFQRRGLGVNMMELRLDSTCWRKFHRPLVQKTISFRIVRLSVSSEMAQELHLIWMIFCVHLICISSQEETGFIYKGFGETDHGVAKGSLQLTDGSRLIMGHTFFKNPFEFSSTRSLSFSTQLVCALLSKAGFVCGHGTAFLVPELVLPAIIMYLALVAVIVYLEKNYAKPREEWEKEDNGPRRFTYKSLYMATKGFNKNGLVRRRCFGGVNRGTPIETRRERRRKERKYRN